MKNLLLSLKDFILILAVSAIVYVCCTTMGQGLTAAEFFGGVKNLQYVNLYISLGTVFVAMQLVVMRWSGYVMNVLLTFSSILLFAMMATIALGPGISMTTILHNMAESVGMGNPLKANPALYWLIPTTWFLTLLGARDQVRTFCTALVCYALWLVFTPMLSNVVTQWATQDEPVLPQVADIMTGADWMPAAVLGAFLLIFSVIVGLLDAIFPEKKES